MLNLNIEAINLSLKERHIVCLSPDYTGNRSNLPWKCGLCGHEWNTSYRNIQGNLGKAPTGCPQCSLKKRGIKRRLSDAELQNLAASRGGRFLGRIENSGKITAQGWWQCEKAHKWPASISHVKLGTWCPDCAGKFKTIGDLASLGVTVNLTLLDSEYRGMTARYQWDCNICNRTVRMFATNISKGRGCRWCAGKSVHSLTDCQKLAVDRGGRCLSDEYVNANAKLRWQCGLNHDPWFASLMNIKGNRSKIGTWCPECSSSLGERICRIYFQSIFQKKFSKATNLPWLKSSSGSQLTLDGYNEELGLAFEHQGEQHFKKS